MASKRMVAIVTGTLAATVGVLTVPWSALADQQILDDLIVDGSACVGFDCVNGESFGFDTLRLKENNLRIKFLDTSTSASFPSNDWQLTANDTSNGGLNRFSIDDITGGRTPFTVEAGARNHALYVESDGDVGIGTNNPAVDLEIVTGNTPTTRLQQDGTSGFTPQTWDVAGNEANFFVRDATNGSTLPFRIMPGAPTNALAIEGSTGDVGMGVQSAEANLHIRETGTEAAGAANEGLLRLENSNGTAQSTRFYIENSAAEWFFQVAPNGDFRVTNNANATFAFEIDTAGNITLKGDVDIEGVLTCNGVAC